VPSQYLEFGYLYGSEFWHLAGHSVGPGSNSLDGPAPRQLPLDVRESICECNAI